MRLAFVADGRSPIARSWIRYFVENGSEVHLISTSICSEIKGLKSLHTVPVAFSGLRRRIGGSERPSALTSARTIDLRTTIRHWLGPATIGGPARKASSLVSEIKPDLVHAMRIPFEGALAGAADPPAPLLISVWGNDFTLHAPASPMMRGMTERALARTDALHTDTQRDGQLAVRWGFDQGRPLLVIPGNGGVRREVFYPGDPGRSEHPAVTHMLEELAPEVPIIVNPRGFRAYVRSDTFFRSIPHVLKRAPQAVFVCPNMAGHRQAEEWITKLGVAESVRLLPLLTPSDLAVVFRRAQVSISPSEHDGTPNTLLEAMACGAFPVAGDLDSIREWINDGENGILFDPDQVDQAAEAIVRALEDVDLRNRAAESNRRIIESRADYERCMRQAQAFYEELVR